MTHTGKALLWAAAIIGAAIIAALLNLDHGVKFGVVTGLSGAAWASLQYETGCGKGCLQ